MELLVVLILVAVGVIVLTRKPRDTWAPDLLKRWPAAAEAAGLKGATLHSSECKCRRAIADPVKNEWGGTATVHLRPGQTVEDTRDAVRKLDSALGVRQYATRMEPVPERASDVILRVVERDPHEKPIDWPGPSLTSILNPVTLGLYETGEPVRVTLAYQHILIAGKTGSGKSGAINLLIGELVNADDVEVWGIDFKGGMELRPWARVLKRLATDPQEAKVLLSDAVQVVADRQRQLGGDARLWRPTRAAPAIVIPCDEQGELAAADARDKTLKLIDKQETISRTGRALAVTQATALQRALQSELGSDVIRQQASISVCFRVKEQREADLVFGQGAANNGWHPHRLTLPGKFLIEAPEQGLLSPRPARAYRVTDGMVRRTATSSALGGGGSGRSTPSTDDHGRGE